MNALRAWLGLRGLPLVPFAPAVVVLFGAAVAVAMGLLGLVQLRLTSDRAASEKAAALARALAPRVGAVASEDRDLVVAHTARRVGVDLMLVQIGGRVLIDTDVGPPPTTPIGDLLIAGVGFTDTATGRAAFAAQQLAPPLEHLSIVVFVHAPATPAGARGLLRSVALLAALLVGVAASVAYSFSRRARDDVDFVRERIEAMARAELAPLGQPVPVRTFDQVGVVTSTFNGLLERFAAAQRAYRHDLDEADELDRARSRFLATLSHELRTPLNAILGFADVLLAEVDGPLTASAREDLETIRASGEHLRALIDDILDLSAIETGSLRLERRTNDVFEIAEEVVREAQALVAGRPVTLSVRGEPGAAAHVDRRRVRQILANLVGNAAKFTRRGGIEVAVERCAAGVAIEVSDTGPGIDPADVAHIFDEYRQSGDAASRRKGTGLGLSIARRLTLAHGGTLALRSRPGEGATFRVELPGPLDGRPIGVTRGAS